MNAADTQAFFARPLDVLLFRDGRPFSAGDDHRATGSFPPSPSALYGALRAAALAQHGARFRAGHPFGLSEDSEVIQEMGGTDRTSGMAITHFSLAYEHADGHIEPLYPMPNDVLKIKKKVPGASDAPAWLRVVPEGFEENFVQPRTNHPAPSLRALWQRRDERAWYEDHPGFVTQQAFADYLVSGTPPLPFKHPSSWRDADGTRSAFATEARTSLEIADANKTADDGKLYTVEFTRPNCGIGFALRLRDARSLGSEEQWLRLGGEARAARLEPHSFEPFPRRGKIEARVRASVDGGQGRFTLVLATPAPFASGWLPDGIAVDGSGTLGGCKVRLVGAALGRFQSVGGWNIVARRPYPTRRAVPAGSVYFFELTEEKPNVEALFDAHFGQSLLTDPDYRKLGLGIGYLGTWKPQSQEHHA